MLAKIAQLWRDEDGVTTVECALVLAIVVVAGAAAYANVGSVASDSVTQATGEMSVERADLWRQAASTGQLR